MEDEEFVLHVAVTVGVGLALVSIAMLIVYNSPVATYIQAASVITMRIPARVGRSPSDNASGFTQAIDTDKIVRVAIKLDIMVELKYRPGDYVVEVRAIAPVFPPGTGPARCCSGYQFDAHARAGSYSYSRCQVRLRPDR